VLTDIFTNLSRINIYFINRLTGKKREAILVTVLGCPYVCETSRLPHFLDNRLTDGGDVSLRRRPPFTSQEDSWYSFLLKAESTPGP
jgi:hypothetical protein